MTTRRGRRAVPRATRPRRAAPAPWARLPREELLDLRFKDLGLTIEGTWLETMVEALYRELADRDIAFRPHVWLSHDWYSPDGIPGIAVPFYLAHPRLRRLERSLMFEVEGDTADECLRLLRHECAHALQHAYQPQRRERWGRVFGKSSLPYPVSYRPNPASRRYVQHLRLYYAQSHPDEDFAETFAVWMQPRAQWRRRYEEWPAIKKLEYVEELMAELREQPPRVRSRATIDPVSRLRTTLREYYAEKHALYRVTHEEIYDGSLKTIFTNDPRHGGRQTAGRFLQRHRAEIRRTVARWSGQYEYALDQIIGELIRRSDELGLVAVGTERRLLLDVAGMLAVRTTQFLYGRRASITL